MFLNFLVTMAKSASAMSVATIIAQDFRASIVVA